MPSQDHSTASSRPYPWFPRLTVSGGGQSQSQHSAYTIYSDVESDHDVFAFIPPPLGGPEPLVQPPPPDPLLILEEDPRGTTALRLPTSESHRRQAIPSFGQVMRRLTDDNIPGTRPTTQNMSEEHPHSPPSILDSARGGPASSEGSDIFNFAFHRQGDVSRLVSSNDVSTGFSEGPSVPFQFNGRERDLR